LHNSISREYGQFSLGQYNETDEDAILNFFLRTSETEKAIDIIELTFKYIDTVIRKNLLQYHYRER
jgi:hypothetical protein